MDETWIHHYRLEDKNQLCTKVAKSALINWKDLGQYALGCTCIIFIDYLERSKTFTGEYYALSLNCLNKEIKSKMSHMAKKRDFFLKTKHRLTHS